MVYIGRWKLLGVIPGGGVATNDLAVQTVLTLISGGPRIETAQIAGAFFR